MSILVYALQGVTLLGNEKMISDIKPKFNIPVGEFIKEELEYRGWTQNDLALIIGTTEKTISKIIKGTQGITFDMAYKLSKTFGQSPGYWLNLYNNYIIKSTGT